MISGTHRYTLMERVVYGRPVAEVLREEMARRGKARVCVITNRSLAETPAIAGIVAALGEHHAGSYSGVLAHSPRPCVVAGAAAARACGADLLLAVGGGSVIDAAKAMLLCLRHGCTTEGELAAHAGARSADPTRLPTDAALWPRMIAVPTTLSGAEFTWYGGITDPARRLKEGYAHPLLIPQAVILDPAMTLTTPLPLLLATGMKAVDHAVERITSGESSPYSDAVSSLALSLLSRALPAACSTPGDLKLRADLQYGMFMSMAGAAAGRGLGVSHAIGHALGGYAGVGHGHTSCVMLPAVMRWSSPANAHRQALVCQAMGQTGEDAASALAELVAAIGMPGRLRDVGVTREDFGPLAEQALHDPLIRNSLRPVHGAAEVEAMLELAW